MAQIFKVLSRRITTRTVFLEECLRSFTSPVPRSFHSEGVSLESKRNSLARLEKKTNIKYRDEHGTVRIRQIKVLYKQAILDDNESKKRKKLLWNIQFYHFLLLFFHGRNRHLRKLDNRFKVRVRFRCCRIIQISSCPFTTAIPSSIGNSSLKCKE